MLKGPSTFKTRVFSPILLLVLATVSLMGYLYILRQSAVIERDLEKRGQSFVTILARNLKIGLLTRSNEYIDEAVESVVDLDDVLSVRVYDTHGKVLREIGKESNPRQDVIPTIDLFGKDLSSKVFHFSGHVTLVAPVYYVASSIGGDNLELYPVVTGKRVVIGFVGLSLAKQSIVSAQKDVRNLSIITALLFCILGGLIAYYIASSVTSPLSDLVKDIRDMKDRGLRNLPLRGPSEIHEVSIAFNMMADNLNKKEQERKEAEERISRQVQKLSSLRSIDLIISSSLDIRMTLKVFIDHVVSQLSVDAANVLLFNPHTRTLEYAASQGFRTSALRHSHLRFGDGYAGIAALENRIVRIPNLKEEDNVFARRELLKGEDFITYYGVPLVAKGHVIGVLEIFHRSPLEPNEEWFEFLDALSLQAAIAIDNNSLFYELERSNRGLILAYDSTIEGWSRALDYRDKETEGHSQRVTELTLRLAREMGVNEEELVHVRRGALLHDIGKMGIPDSILLKAAALTDEEWKIMRLHPVYSYELLHPIEYLRTSLDIPYCHHEKWDGTGYPRGLKGEQIPLSARIFAVVDVWDALRSDRPYRPAWTEEKTKEYIGSLSGIQFDPEVVKVFLRAIAEKKD
jgi:putative nucleotidyltransferase with HDIG domain